MLTLRKCIVPFLFLLTACQKGVIHPSSMIRDPQSFDPCPKEAQNESVSPQEISLNGGTNALFWQNPKGRSEAGIVFVSGVDGGYIEPVDGIYDRIAAKFAKQCVPAVFVKYRNPGVLQDSIDDALAGAQLLRKQGVTRMALIGWSFGGAVIVNSAVKIPEVITVVGFAPQSRYTEPAAYLDSQSILLFHSPDDENVPYVSSEEILELIPRNLHQELFTVEHADHHLDGQGEIIDPVAYQWLQKELVGLNLIDE